MITARLSPSRLSAFVLAAALFASAAALALDLKKTLTFDIPPQSLTSALLAFGKQANVQVMSSASDISVRQSKGVNGKLSIEAALDQLLQDTGLRYRTAGDGTIMIVTPAAAGTADTQMRLANVAADDEDKQSAASNHARDRAEVVVQDTRIKPYSDASVDLPRTIDDAQPYYIFDSNTIERSGATTIEDFLTNKLTMHVNRGTNTSNISSYGTNSTVNLRGLGESNTLVLVNGRRMPDTVLLSTRAYQPDLNGISPSMIDRIEVLPSSASGIYGGNALGGVVNVILKKDYTGGDVRVNYGNTWNTDSMRRSVAANWGTAFEDGKSRLQISAHYSDGNAMRMQDRVDLIRRNYARVFFNYPAQVYSPTSPFPGATTNIANTTADNLVLDDGTMLSSPITHVSPGTAPGISLAQLGADLAANAGGYNLDLPSIYWAQTGLGTYFGFTPASSSISASFTRRTRTNLEAFVDYSFNRNRGRQLYSNYFSSRRRVSADASPFTTDVNVTMPAEYLKPSNATHDKTTATVGLKATLAQGWIAEFDYTRAEAKAKLASVGVDSGSVNVAIGNGTIDPFVDTQMYPVSLDPYGASNLARRASTQNHLALRGSGPLPKFLWGTPTLTVGLENRQGGTDSGDSEYMGPTRHTNTVYLGNKQTNTSIYAEVHMPLVKQDRFALVHALDLQLTGRYDRYTINTGTSSKSIDLSTGTVTYGSPNLNGEPVRYQTNFTSVNPTIGLKYQPDTAFTLRVSYSTAFQPPAIVQLQKNPLPRSSLTTITDPQNGMTYGVQTVIGGNPDVLPQTAQSWNAGVIWAPQSGRLQGLRANAQYYEINQDDSISTLGAQAIIGLYPGRVTRDASGMITLVDTSYLNLYQRKMAGWDFTVDYELNTKRAGAFAFHGVHSLVVRSTTQYSLTLPAYTNLDYPLDTTIGGVLRRQSNFTLSWDRGPWSAGWTARLLSSYNAYGSAGGPLSQQYASGGNYSTYAAAQGDNGVIPAQDIHDIVVGYSFGRGNGPGRMGLAGLADGTTVTVGIKNIFNTPPAFDAATFNLGFFSPFVDERMREGWITVTRSF